MSGLVEHFGLSSDPFLDGPRTWQYYYGPASLKLAHTFSDIYVRISESGDTPLYRIRVGSFSTPEQTFPLQDAAAGRRLPVVSRKRSEKVVGA